MLAVLGLPRYYHLGIVGKRLRMSGVAWTKRLLLGLAKA